MELFSFRPSCQGGGMMARGGNLGRSFEVVACAGPDILQCADQPLRPGTGEPECFPSLGMSTYQRRLWFYVGEGAVLRE